jgi:hypothetical protein
MITDQRLKEMICGMKIYADAKYGIKINEFSSKDIYSALLELAEYRKNPIANMIPCWKYVRENSIQQQLEHVRGECDEVADAMTMDDKKIEWFDVLQGAVTGMYILKTKYHVDIAELIQQGIYKNTHRHGGSYYE